MEFVNVYLKIGGDLANVIHKTDVSVAEAKVLFELHGGERDQPIKEVEIVADRDVDARELKAHLLNKYGKTKPEYRQLVENLFPGVTPPFFEKASDIGLPEGVKILGKPGPKPKTKPKANLDPLG